MTLPPKGTLDLSGADENGYIVETGGVGSGKTVYYAIEIPSDARSGNLAVHITVEEIDKDDAVCRDAIAKGFTCGAGDIAHLAKTGALPYLYDFESYDAAAWAQGNQRHSLLIDAKTGGLRPGTLYVAVSNTAYAESRAYYRLRVDASSRCPFPSGQVCSGHGTCKAVTAVVKDICECNAGYSGAQCEKHSFELSPTPGSNQNEYSTLSAGMLAPHEWVYHRVPYVRLPQQELQIKLVAFDSSSDGGPFMRGETDQDIFAAAGIAQPRPLLLVREGSAQDLATDALVNFASWSDRSTTQLVSIKLDAVAENDQMTAFVGVFNPTTSLLGFNLTANIITPSDATASAAKIASPWVPRQIPLPLALVMVTASSSRAEA